MSSGTAGYPPKVYSVEIRLIVCLTQTAYDALTSKDAYTLYLITGA